MKQYKTSNGTITNPDLVAADENGAHVTIYYADLGGKWTNGYKVEQGTGGTYSGCLAEAKHDTKAAAILDACRTIAQAYHGNEQIERLVNQIRDNVRQLNLFEL